jgi:raffinose/stachyose/melibiose transport system substrate-binding protein
VQPALNVLIPNFERVYPNIRVEVTYTPTSPVLSQLETTELAAGNAPDLMTTNPGCGTVISICVLAKAGDVSPLVNAPWVKWSLPLVTSSDKYGQGLFAFTPSISVIGMFTNGPLFAKLRLKVPQTFPQLLALCQEARADGTVAMLFGGATAPLVQFLITALALPVVYMPEEHWQAKLRAGAVSFDGTPGWHQAMQEFIDMNNAGCFQPGAVGASGPALEAQFAQGQALMLWSPNSGKGMLDADSPAFSYSFAPFPAGTNSNESPTLLNPSFSLSVNAHSSPQHQAAATTFIDFLARPKQNALYTQVLGGLSQYALLKGQLPSFMSPFAEVFRERDYVINPVGGWWNANVLAALEQDGIGLLTGQESIDAVLNAMDAAWKQGPS